MGDWLPQVVVIGAACLDVKGHVPGHIQPATSNPGQVRVTVGGVARNVAENLARLGTPTALLAVVGRDPYGHEIVKHTGAAGVDVSAVLFLRGQRTASYVALIDGEGNLAAAVDDTSIFAELTPRYIYGHRGLFRQARMAVVDANTPLDTFATIRRVAGRYQVPICLDTVSLELARHYQDGLQHLQLLACGAGEAEVLTGRAVASRRQAAAAARALVAAGAQVVIISLGLEGVVYASTEHNGHVPAIPGDVIDSTGVSEALTATVIYGLVNRIALDEAVWLGVAAAALTAQSLETVRNDLSLDLLYQRLVR